MKQDIKIYKLESEVVLAIDRMAKEHGMSRNKYLIGILENHVIAGEIKEVEERYVNLIKTNMEVIQHNSETLEMLKQEILMEKYLEEERRRANES